MDDLPFIQAWLVVKVHSWGLAEGMWRQDGMDGDQKHDLMVILWEIKQGEVLAHGDRDVHHKHQVMGDMGAMAALARNIFNHCQISIPIIRPTEEWLNGLNYEDLQGIMMEGSLYGGGSTNRRKRRKTKKRRKPKKRKSKTRKRRSKTRRLK